MVGPGLAYPYLPQGGFIQPGVLGAVGEQPGGQSRSVSFATMAALADYSEKLPCGDALPAGPSANATTLPTLPVGSVPMATVPMVSAPMVSAPVAASLLPDAAYAPASVSRSHILRSASGTPTREIPHSKTGPSGAGPPTIKVPQKGVRLTLQFTIHS